MKPLIYGYIRVSDSEPDQVTRRTELQLRAFADDGGYSFAEIFHEFEPHWQRRAFEALIGKLKETDARYVVLPSLDHLTHHRLLLAHMLARLECEVGAHVFELAHPRSG